MTARYVLCPGVVTSRTDGQRHYVSASSLAALYGLRVGDCTIAPASEQDRRGYRHKQGDVYLHPRYDGNYKLPAIDAAMAGGGE